MFLFKNYLGDIHHFHVFPSSPLSCFIRMSMSAEIAFVCKNCQPWKMSHVKIAFTFVNHWLIEYFEKLCCAFNTTGSKMLTWENKHCHMWLSVFKYEWTRAVNITRWFWLINYCKNNTFKETMQMNLILWCLLTGWWIWWRQQTEPHLKPEFLTVNILKPRMDCGLTCWIEGVSTAQPDLSN